MNAQLRFAFSMSMCVLALGCELSPTDGADSDPVISDAQNLRKRNIVVANGETQPVYVYADAIRELIYVEAPMDSDGDGKKDRIAMEVMRPKETATGLKVASVMEASPYNGEAFNARIRGAGAAALSEPRGFWGWYDEFFVPRGYAVVEVEMQGTTGSTGCPTTGGKEDTLSVVAAIDWLNGRANGFHEDGTPAVATWSTGAVGMIGVSYNGTLPIAAASTGVAGLKTIVPIGAISSWYDYARDQGIGYSNGWDERYPEWLANYVVSNAAKAKCGAQIRKLGDNADDVGFDYTAFWAERNYRPNVGNIKAAVFAVHGLEDWNVKTHQFSRLWYELAARDVPRKIWLHREGHIDPVSIRRTIWQKTMHHWMDHWLYDLDNGVMNEPMLDIQRPNGTWSAEAIWPPASTHPVMLYLARAEDEIAGSLRSWSSRTIAVDTLTDEPTRSESTLISVPEEKRPYRLAYATEILTAPVRISGTARVHATVEASTASAPLTALLVDYGTTTSPLPRTMTTEELMTQSCEMADLNNRTGCAAIVPDVMRTTTALIVSRGSIDLKNRSSMAAGAVLTPGERFEVDWELHAKDHIFPAGHRIGLIITGNDRDYVAVDTRAKSVSVILSGSLLTLPVSSGM